MGKNALQGVRFIASAPRVDKLPIMKNDRGLPLPEIAILGRSNVGKSSLLNMLFYSKSLVKVSSTPGKTQALNLFALDGKIAFVDLPGYGYAAVSDKVRRQWRPMIEGYFKTRESLTLVLFLFDIRREPTEEDRQLMSWLIAKNLAVILVITKSDKVSKGNIAGRCRQIVQGFHVENLQVACCSSAKNEGREDLLWMLFDALENEENDDAN